MGEAKRKVVALRKFAEGLSKDELLVGNAAIALLRRVISPNRASGLCYWSTFFLTTYLRDVHKISVEPRVGYVWDQETPLMASHAWLEFNGKKTDVSLAVTENQEVQLVGRVLVHDYVYRPGHEYLYFQERPPEALQALSNLLADAQYAGLVEHKEAEHQQMSAVATSRELQAAYLADAPLPLSYRVISSAIDEFIERSPVL